MVDQIIQKINHLIQILANELFFDDFGCIFRRIDELHEILFLLELSVN